MYRYLTVDYERGNFSISQAIFPDSLGKKIVAIQAPDNPTTNPASTSSQPTTSSSSNKTIGIAIGVALGILCLVSAIAIFLCRRRKSPRNTNTQPHPPPQSPSPSILSQLKKCAQYARPPAFSSRSSSRTVHMNEAFDKNEMSTDMDHSRYEAPGSEPVQESTTLLPPPPAFTDHDLQPRFPSELGGDTTHPAPPIRPPQELYASGSFAPIELPTTHEPLWMTQAEMSKAPAEADGATVQRASSGRKGSLRSLLGSGRPGLHHRHSTLDSLPSAPSDGGTPEARGMGEGEFFSPISPVGERPEWVRGGEGIGR
jgi:hypothetical protein